MRIGDLRHRVTILHQTDGVDEWGAPAPGQWVPLATVWACVEGLRGNEYWQAQQLVDQADHRITIRYRRDVTAQMRVQHDGRLFEIRAALDRDGRRRWLELICREVLPWQNEARSQSP